jgi:hypothetical protein
MTFREFVQYKNNSNHWLLPEAKKPQGNKPGRFGDSAHSAARDFARHTIDIIKRHRDISTDPTDPISAGERQATDNAMELMDIAQRHGAGVDARRTIGRNTPPHLKDKK